MTGNFFSLVVNSLYFPRKKSLRYLKYLSIRAIIELMFINIILCRNTDPHIYLIEGSNCYTNTYTQTYKIDQQKGN